MLSRNPELHQEALEQIFDQRLAAGYLNFVVDMKDIPFPTTRFIALIISLTTRARRQNGDIGLINMVETARHRFTNFNTLSYLKVEGVGASSSPLNTHDRAAASIEPPRRDAMEDTTEMTPALVTGIAAFSHSLPQNVEPSAANRAFKLHKIDPAQSLDTSQEKREHPDFKDEPAVLTDIVDPPLVKELVEEIETPEAPEKEKSYQIRVESRASNLYQLCDFVTEHAALAGISEKEIAKIKIAVYEACLNVIEHAYHSRPDEWVELQVRYSSERFMIIILDRGLSFEMKPPEPYDVEEVMDERRSGGFGMHIIRRAMDQVEYHADPINGNRLVMLKRLRHPNNTF
jgi:anti-sigma regulatory factor (Ser/Thr protein kinase)